MCRSLFKQRFFFPFAEIDGPTNLVTNHVTEDTATISWHGPQAPIERYVVTFTSADGDTKEMSVGKDKTTTTLMGLKPGMEYTIYIWTVKGAQQSRKASTRALTGSTDRILLNLEPSCWFIIFIY